MTREELNKAVQEEIFHEQNKENVKKTIKIIIKLLLIIVILGAIFFAYTTYISTKKIIVNEYRITNKKLPANFNGIKIIQFSDLHYGSTMFIEDVNKIANLSNERKPDIVVFTGDLINKQYNMKSSEQEKLIEKLKQINASLGKYAILGDEDSEKVSTIFNQSDFTILRNEYDLLYNDTNNPILLIGLSSSLKNNQDIDKAYGYFKEETHNSDIFTITLLHEPDSVDEIINTYNTDLFLAGHSHNGNIRIPYFNISLFKYQGAKKYYKDYYKINNSELFISSGLGTKDGIRLFCRPSINFFRLSSE